MPKPKSFRYFLNKNIRHAVRWMMHLLFRRSEDAPFELHKEQIKKILLVRPTFRLGHAVLATPAIFLFRKTFPQAEIDFVGAPLSKTLFHNLPIDTYFTVTRRFPHSSWTYLAMVKRLREAKYDLAVDLSCSQSALGAFIAGFSKARFRIGLRGEWDRWFNVRIQRPREKNKYQNLPAFLEKLGLKPDGKLPSLALSPEERNFAKERMRRSARFPERSIVGVFLGGRQRWGKRWPIGNFSRLVLALSSWGLNVVLFAGPEEMSLMRSLNETLPEFPLIWESSVRKFAALVSDCNLFLTSDSGPMHLACAVGVPTVAIFQNPNFDPGVLLPASAASSTSPADAPWKKC